MEDVLNFLSVLSTQFKQAYGYIVDISYFLLGAGIIIFVILGTLSNERGNNVFFNIGRYVMIAIMVVSAIAVIDKIFG